LQPALNKPEKMASDSERHGSDQVRAYPAFHIISKPSGPICNLDCNYCFYLEKEKLYPDATRWSMSPGVLEEFIRQYILAQDVPVISFTWQGGEPTLAGLDFFRRVVELQRKYAAGRRIENSLQTNAVLIDGEWAAFLAQEQFLVGVSIDGPEELHDGCRKYKGGRGSFSDVFRGLRHLQEAGVEFNTLSVVNRLTSQQPLEVYRFLCDIGSHYMQFIPAVERIASMPDSAGLTIVTPSHSGSAEVSDWSVEPEPFGRFLCAIFDEWVRNDVARRYVQLFDVTLENWLGMTPSLCVFRETCGGALAVEHNGDLYSCDYFVYPEHRLGNIMEKPLESLVNSPAQVAFGNAKRDTLPQYCLKCDVKFACQGECPKHRFAITPDGEAGLNYLCAGYKQFFHHVAPYMDFMAKELREGRAPANVMAWARSR
jgi:uncharacterized protein